MGFVEHAWFLDSNKHVMVSAQYFGKIMKHQDSFEK
jgi:hypothetical protein